MLWPEWRKAKATIEFGQHISLDAMCQRRQINIMISSYTCMCSLQERPQHLTETATYDTRYTSKFTCRQPTHDVLNTRQPCADFSQHQVRFDDVEELPLLVVVVGFAGCALEQAWDMMREAVKTGDEAFPGLPQA